MKRLRQRDRQTSAERTDWLNTLDRASQNIMWLESIRSTTNVSHTSRSQDKM